MNPLSIVALVILGIAGYLASREVGASSLPRISVFPGSGDIFDPQVTVTIPDVPTMSDEEYARVLLEKGYDPREFGYSLPSDMSDDMFIKTPPVVSDVAPINNEQANLSAFLALIRELESRNNYYALVGGGNFSDTSDHPANLGWPGIIMPGGYRTAAAGAYQIQPGTMREVQTRFGVPKGFTPEIQDQLAIGILQLPWRNGAYYDVLKGDFDTAFRKLQKEWEAFERIINGNYHFTFEQAKAFYAQNGGTFA